MNSKRAKKIRKTVYGAELSPKARKYYRNKAGARLADPLRRMYQQAKEEENAS
jgi:hypothetical protein